MILRFIIYSSICMLGNFSIYLFSLKNIKKSSQPTSSKDLEYYENRQKKYINKTFTKKVLFFYIDIFMLLFFKLKNKKVVQNLFFWQEMLFSIFSKFKKSIFSKVSYFQKLTFFKFLFRLYSFLQKNPYLVLVRIYFCI